MNLYNFGQNRDETLKHISIKNALFVKIENQENKYKKV